jgi:pilus assembly protein CpaF
MEVLEMKSYDFGRRLVDSGSRAMVPVAEATNGRAGDNVYLTDVKERVRAILLTRIDAGVAGTMSRQLLRSEIAPIVREIATEERVQLNSIEESQLADELTADMVGLGPLEPFLDDEEVTDILVNGPLNIFVERHGKLEKTNARFRDAEHVFTIVQRIASAVGRRIDEASPMVDARLADGSRVNIVLPPLVLNGGTISIRKFSRRNITLEAMVQTNNLSKSMARFLDVAARARFNIIISGGTGSGKTTLLNAMSRSIDPSERIITIEDAVELRLQQPHIVQMETRMANIEGVGEIPQRALVRNALRMRPDRIILGEVRGTEAFDMLQAMNTGHDGSMSTIHANSPRDALSRMENMVLMATQNLPLRAMRMQIASAVNLVVQVERMRDGIRRVTSVVEVTGLEGDIITTRELFSFKYHGETRDGLIDGIFEPSPGRPALIERAAHFGLDHAMLEALGVKTV